MEHSRPHRPRVSRETRLLLSTALVATLALWILARVRFPDQPAAPTPVQPLLTQLGARGSFEDLASELAQLRPRIEPLLVGGALRIREDAALTLLASNPGSDPGSHLGSDPDVIGLDRASRLAVVRAPAMPAQPPAVWKPGDPAQPRYFMATDPATGALALRPVLVGSLVPTASPLWREPVWLVPPGTDLLPGSFVFTTDALLVGLAVEVTGRIAIIPAALLLQEADRLLGPGVRMPGTFGIEVQAITPPVARATGAAGGVVVTWVDPGGPSADTLAVGDVIETADGEAVTTPLHWTARAARATAGSSVTVTVRRDGEVREVGLIAAPLRPAAAADMLGLTLRNVPGTGSMIVEVEAGSPAERAGLRSGDVITLAGGLRTPSPAAVRRAWDRAPAGTAVLVAYLRDRAPAVTALEKP
ncbi:MAG: PDZ domain-containing protein [Acidobacteria bacterium]|nr:PDZ domain-containing protein [Acidobacteriota bacterium]